MTDKCTKKLMVLQNTRSSPVKQSMVALSNDCVG